MTTKHHYYEKIWLIGYQYLLLTIYYYCCCCCSL